MISIQKYQKYMFSRKPYEEIHVHTYTYGYVYIDVYIHIYM